MTRTGHLRTASPLSAISLCGLVVVLSVILILPL
jgi:hypothetical protein